MTNHTDQEESRNDSPHNGSHTDSHVPENLPGAYDVLPEDTHESHDEHVVVDTHDSQEANGTETHDVHAEHISHGQEETHGHDSHDTQASHDDHGSHTSSHDDEPKPSAMREFASKVLVVGVVVVFIIVGGYGIIKAIPSIYSSLASVSVSISSVFKPKTSPTPTPETSPASERRVTVTEVIPEPEIEEETRVAIIALQTKTDLSVRIISVGVLNKTTGQFSAKNTIDMSERAAVRFEVINIGGKASGSWTFNALLPTESDQKIFSSNAQRTLTEGDRIEFTMGFDGISRTGRQSLILSVDEGNFISESNKANNVATAFFNVTGEGTSNRNPVSGTRADLTLRVIQTGIEDPNTGVFSPRTRVYPGERAAVRFIVTNNGGTETGTWTWNAVLPSSGDNRYESDRQRSLTPGESMEFVIGFDNFRDDQSRVSVFLEVDPDNRVRETNENNNELTTVLNVQY